MIKTVSLFCLTGLLLPLISLSQSEAAIRTHYHEVNQRIAESVKQGYEGPLYNNHWVTNKNGRSWPAVGIYSETTDFWYDDPPDHLDESERNPGTVLLKVETVQQSTSYIQAEEYLYKDSHLVFYYQKMSEGGDNRESRFYFNESGVLIKSSYRLNDTGLTDEDLKSGDHADFFPNPEQAKSRGLTYQQLFVKSMRIR